MRRFTTVARLKKAWGKEGALIIVPETEVDLEKLKGQEVFIAPPLKEVTLLKVNEVLAKGKHLVVFFEGINSIDAAESLEGRFVQVESGSLRKLQEEKDEECLAGYLCFTDSGEKIGLVKEVLKYPAHLILVVDYAGQTVMIPFVDEFVKEVSHDDKRVIIFLDKFTKNWGSNA